MSESGAAKTPTGTRMSIQELAVWEQRIKDLTQRLEEVTAKKKTVKLEVEQARAKLEVDEAKQKLVLTEGSRLRSQIEGLVEKNKDLTRMLDEAASQGQLFMGKMKDFELYRETTRRLIQDQKDRLDYFQEKYKDGVPLHSQTIENLQEMLEKKQVLLDELKEQNFQLAKEDSAEEIPSPLRKQQLAAFRQLQEEEEERQNRLKQREAEEDDLKEKIINEEKLEAYLSQEIEELALRKRVHELELEEESRLAQEELLKAKRNAQEKAQIFESTEAQGTALSSRLKKLEEDLEFLKEKRTNLAKRTQQALAGDSQNSDLKMLETLNLENKELRGDFELLVHQRARLEQTQKKQNEDLRLRQEELLSLSTRLASFYKADHQEDLTAEEKARLANALNKSPFDCRNLVEKLTEENIRLEMDLRLRQAKQLVDRTQS